MARATGTVARAQVLLVCSSGGHLLQLLSLAEAWRGCSRIWVTFDREDARSLLRGERVVIAHHPTNRHIGNLLRNTLLALRVVPRVRPRVVVTTGAGVAVPVAWVARLTGARVVYVESVTRIHGLSLSGRMIRPVANRLYVQWPELAQRVPEARFAGQVLETR